MTRRRFFVPLDKIRDGVAELPPEQIHHARNVLRLRAGDEVEVFDGEGHGYIGRIEKRSARIVIGSLERIDAAAESPLALVLALALIKAEKFEWILQKGTELGVREFVPLETRFGEVRISENKLDSRLERWRRIVSEASRQCRRHSVPKLHRPRTFMDFMAANDFPHSAKFFVYENAPGRWDGSAVNCARLVLCIGPEGGWDHAEVEAAERARYLIFGLGPRILRTETAALAALAIFQFRLGDLGERQAIDD